MEMKSIFIILSSVLIVSGVSATSIIGSTAFAKMNCHEENRCTGGFGYGSGGAGGNFEIEDNTYTQSGGGGSSSLPGGGGGHLESNFETGEYSRSGGNSDTGGGRCTGNLNDGELDCTGKD